MELMLTILLLKIGILGLSYLFANSSQAYYLLERSLKALELLRGEMERLESYNFNLLQSEAAKEIEWGMVFTLDVLDQDPDEDEIIEYKILTGQVIWSDFFGKRRCYQFVTYRHRDL